MILSGIGEETTRVGEWSRLGRQGNPGRRDNFFSYKHFGLPTWDNTRHAECHIFSKFQVLKYKFTSQKQNKLNKAHTDQMNERKSKLKKDI